MITYVPEPKTPHVVIHKEPVETHVVHYQPDSSPVNINKYVWLLCIVLAVSDVAVTALFLMR